MQEAVARSNRERTDATRKALLTAARTLFVEKGYAGASTPEIVAAAGITRGALYHHFKDKQDLFRAVVEQEARAVADAIEAATSTDPTARDALMAGSTAYLDAMAVTGRTRLLLLEGPAALGPEAMRGMDEDHAARTLRQGLEEAVPKADGVAVAALAMLLSAAFDRAALAIDAGADTAELRNALLWLIARTTGPIRRR